MIEFLKYKLPMTGPPTTGGEPIRHGVLLSTEFEGTRYYGDLCPLPGLHRHSLSDYLKIIGVTSTLHRQQAAGWLRQPAQELPEPWINLCQEYPALSFALFTLKAAMHGYAQTVWPFKTPVAKREVAGLLDPANFDTKKLSSGKSASIQLRESGLSGTWKIKIGRGNSRTEIDSIQTLLANSPPSDYEPPGRTTLTVRLDANRKLDLSSIGEWVRLLENPAVAFLEEPFHFPQDYRTFAGQFPKLVNKIAFDESLREPWWVEMQSLYPDPFVIVKPSLLGWQKSRELLNQYGPKGIVSSVFESGIGLNSLAAMGDTAVAAGIGTWRWLKADVLAQPAVHGRHWKFQLRPKVDAGRLERLDL